MVLMEEGGGGSGKVKLIILKSSSIDLILIQARDISAYVEVGQGRQLGEHPPGTRLLSSLQGRQESR